jgi:hypothetical protein
MRTPAPSPTTSQTKWSRIGTVVEGRRWSLSRVVYSQRRCRRIITAIAPVSCERCRRTAHGEERYVLPVFTESQPLIRSHKLTLLPDYQWLDTSTTTAKPVCAQWTPIKGSHPNAVLRHIHATSHVTLAPTPPPRTVQQKSPKTSCAIRTAEP